MVPPVSARAPRCPQPTRVPVPPHSRTFAYRALTSCGGPFQVASAQPCCRAGSLPAPAPQPRTVETARFGLFPFRSPLLGESRLISLPPGTEMFQFPGLAPPSQEVTGASTRRVAPFGHPGINGSVLLPLAFRSLPRPSSPARAQASPVRPYCAWPVPSRYSQEPAHLAHRLSALVSSPTRIVNQLRGAHGAARPQTTTALALRRGRSRTDRDRNVRVDDL